MKIYLLTITLWSEYTCLTAAVFPCISFDAAKRKQVNWTENHSNKKDYHFGIEECDVIE